jgi:hypothetical protein
VIITICAWILIVGGSGVIAYGLCRLARGWRRTSVAKPGGRVHPLYDIWWGSIPFGFGLWALGVAPKNHALTSIVLYVEIGFNLLMTLYMTRWRQRER